MKDIKEYIQESNAIEGIFEPEEIEQSLIAWNYLQGLKTISHYDICRIQKIITLHQTNLQPHQRGYYRSFSKTDVTVGEHTPPKYSEVDGHMENWLKDLSTMTPLVAHIRFEYIHPFVDGNGRVGRMLYWWHCLLLEKTPVYYTAKSKDKYYRLFNSRIVDNFVKTNWGLNYGEKYEVTVKTDKGMIRGKFFTKPTDADIKASIPAGHELVSIISIKEIQ